MARRISPAAARRIAQPESPIHPPPHPVVQTGTAQPSPAPVGPPRKGFETIDPQVVAFLRSHHIRHESEQGRPMVYGYDPAMTETITALLANRKEA